MTKTELKQKLSTPEGAKQHIISMGYNIKHFAKIVGYSEQVFYKILNGYAGYTYNEQTQERLFKFFAK